MTYKLTQNKTYDTFQHLPSKIQTNSKVFHVTLLLHP